MSSVKKNLVQMRDFRMVALALTFTVAMELDMANHKKKLVKP